MSKHSRMVGLIAGALLGLVAGVAAADVETSGKQVTVTVANAEPTEQSGGTTLKNDWRYLQAFQIHLEEKYPGKRIEIDCETNLPEFGEEGKAKEGVSCAEVFAAEKAGDTKGLSGITMLIYKVADSQWNEQLSSAFSYAKRQTNEEAKRKATAGTQPVVVNTLVEAIELDVQPACEQFASPCMYRPMCGGTGKCSKVSTGCVKCTYP